MELRDFFKAVDPEKFVAVYRSMRPDAPGNTPDQFQATSDEVMAAMPLIPTLLDFNRAAVQKNDEAQRLGTAYMILTLYALYRVAESDMGYEW